MWTATWRGGLATDVEARGHSIRVDEPHEVGGGDTGPMPTELLTAALASCMCLAVAWAAAKRRVELPDLRVSARATRVPGEPRYGRYDVWIVSSLPDEAMAPVAELAERYCWVTNTLRNPPDMKFHLGEAGADAPAGAPES
ncbi:MAG: OsmC family protein [Thermoleophilia bacterium]